MKLLRKRKPSLKTALGITKAKRSFSKATGIPTTKSGRKRKALNMATGGAYGKYERTRAAVNRPCKTIKRPPSCMGCLVWALSPFAILLLVIVTLFSIVSAEEVGTESEIIYEDDNGIQKFISIFNSLYPDNVITSDMISKYNRGSVHDDKVILYINNHEISITNDSWIFSGTNYDMSVFIRHSKSDNNDEIKELFFMFMRVFDNALTDEVLEDYWSKQSDSNHYSNINTYDDIECQSTVFRNLVEYIKIEGHIAK